MNKQEVEFKMNDMTKRELENEFKMKLYNMVKDFKQISSISKTAKNLYGSEYKKQFPKFTNMDFYKLVSFVINEHQDFDVMNKKYKNKLEEVSLKQNINFESQIKLCSEISLERLIIRQNHIEVESLKNEFILECYNTREYKQLSNRVDKDNKLNREPAFQRLNTILEYYKENVILIDKINKIIDYRINHIKSESYRGI